MKRAMLVMFSLVLVLSALVAPAYAEPSTDWLGHFVYEVTGASAREAGGNMFIQATDTATWTGAFVGDSTEEYVAVFHRSGRVFYKGTVSFNGVVEGREGSLEILFVGWGSLSLDDFAGTWRIISGAGELANLHGQGTFANTEAFHIDYFGRIHFDPGAD